MYIWKPWRLLLLPKMKKDSGSGSAFSQFLAPDPKKSTESCQSWLQHSGSLPTLVINCLLLSAICGWPVTSRKNSEVLIHNAIRTQQFLFITLMSVAAAMLLWLCTVGGGSSTLCHRWHFYCTLLPKYSSLTDFVHKFVISAWWRVA